MKVAGMHFREVWLADFEFSAPPGERPSVVCLVAWELASGQKLRLWQDELAHMKRPPYGTAADCLFVAYYASAEMGCHLAFGWPLPTNVLDLYAEFRNATNGLTLPCGAGLLGALAWYGLGSIEAADKDSMRQLALRGGPWTDSERQALLDYCESDAAALARLLAVMAPKLDMPRALLRGGVYESSSADRAQRHSYRYSNPGAFTETLVSSEVIRPTLTDREGFAVFIGTPRGYNQFYDLYQEAGSARAGHGNCSEHPRPTFCLKRSWKQQGGR